MMQRLSGSWIAQQKEIKVVNRKLTALIVPNKLTWIAKAKELRGKHTIMLLQEYLGSIMRIVRLSLSLLKKVWLINMIFSTWPLRCVLITCIANLRFLKKSLKLSSRLSSSKSLAFQSKTVSEFAAVSWIYQQRTLYSKKILSDFSVSEMGTIQQTCTDWNWTALRSQLTLCSKEK